MRKIRFTEAQIIGMIKEQEAGLPTSELCRKHGLSPATFYKLKAKYGGMDLSDAKRLKQLEDENAKRKRLLADALPLPPVVERLGQTILPRRIAPPQPIAIDDYYPLRAHRSSTRGLRWLLGKHGFRRSIWFSRQTVPRTVF